MVRERTQTPDPTENTTTTQTLRYVELELAGDVEPLAKALQAELGRKAPNEKHWYGSSSTLYQDYPVRMATAPFLQIRWQVVPSAQKVLERLRPFATIAEPVFLAQDFTHLSALSREEQQQRLRELAERGQTIAAIYTARRLYGCGLSEAKQMIEEHRGQKADIAD
jgi:hypothetical protein